MHTAAPPDAPPAEPPGPAQIFFSFEGRVSRRTWWLYGVAALLGLGVAMVALLRIAGFGAGVAEAVTNLLLLWPALAVSVKRWHDRDRPGWWVLIALVPFVGWLVALVVNGFLPGTPGTNRYGAPEVSTDS